MNRLRVGANPTEKGQGKGTSKANKAERRANFVQGKISEKHAAKAQKWYGGQKWQGDKKRGGW